MSKLKNMSKLLFDIKIIYLYNRRMTYYKCKNCNYQCKIFSDMKKHINLKKMCVKQLNPGFEYSIDQIIILSLIPYNDDGTQSINENMIKDIKYIYENRDELLNILNETDKIKKKECKYCCKKCNKIQDLRNHLLLECFPKEMSKGSNKKESTLNYNIINNNTTTNILSNTINNITNNITNITVNIQTPVSFNENWNLSEISDNEKKFEILCSDVMYTTLLNKILENNVNLNVVIDKQKNIGFVYKNEDEKYVKMKIEEITENSMEKLHDNLLELNNNLIKKESYFKSQSEFNEERIKKKLIDYKQLPDTKKKVNEFLADMFDKKKNEAYQISKNMSNHLIEEGY